MRTIKRGKEIIFRAVKYCRKRGKQLNIKLTKKGKIFACVFCVIFVLFVSLVLLGEFYPNVTENEEFISSATSYITMDYSEYQEKIKEDEKITNLDRVKLWGYIGQATFKSTLNQKYITTLVYTVRNKRKSTEIANDLMEKLKSIYGNDPTINDGTCEWKINLLDEDNQNLKTVTLCCYTDGVQIVWETANNAYLIDYDIDNIGKITLDSKEELDRIQNEYQKLSEQYKPYIEKYSVLEKYIDEYYM
ncbi:MAG: hypothetical protein K2K01_00135, partial [Eubacterium sp.]|nr:hypothetical protein [Eubacterium sp.]